MSEKIAISQSDIIALAMDKMREIDGYSPEMTLKSAQQEDSKIIFRGDFFTDDFGMPTQDTEKVLTIYSKLSDYYSEFYLVD